MTLLTRRSALLVAKLAIAAGVLYFLLTRGSIQLESLLTTLVGNGPLALACMACLMAGLLVGACRWWIILQAAGIRLSYGQVARLLLIGSFFSTWLPGAAGGDAARALYLARSMQSRRTTALFTIVIDRGFALAGLLGVASLLALYFLRRSEMQPVLTFYVWLSVGAISLFTLGGLAVFIIARSVAVPQWPAWLNRARPVAHQLREAVVLIMGHWGAMLGCVVLSLVASGVVAFGIVVISSAFSFAPEPLIAALAGVIGNVSSAIPLTPGGLGIGEAVFARVCIELGSVFAPYATIYLAFRILMMLVSFSGGLFWLTYNQKGSKNIPLPQNE